MNISHRGKMWYNYDRGINDYDWTQVISANMEGSCIKYHNGTIFIAGSSGLYYSENGTAFIKVDGVGSLNGASMLFDNTMWIVAGQSGMYYSSNGTSWTKVTGVDSMSGAALHYNGSLWVVAGYSGLYYSSNGTSTKINGS